MFNFAPILIGAAVGAGTSALFGGNPLKGAALGGLSGGLFGAGGPFETSKLFGGSASGLNVTGSAAGATNTAQTAAGLAEKGLTNMAPIQGFAGTPSGMSPLNAAIEQARLLDPQGFAGGITSLPASAAAPFGGSTGAQSLVNQGLFGSLSQYMPSGQAIGNLGLNTAAQSLMRQPQYISAPAGGISQGKPLDISAVENLVSKRRAQVSQTPGLMGNYFG